MREAAAVEAEYVATVGVETPAAVDERAVQEAEEDVVAERTMFLMLLKYK